MKRKGRNVIRATARETKGRSREHQLRFRRKEGRVSEK
jgi:hypothetical protein